MEIEDSFRVDVPVDEAWRVLLDIERIAPCMPGAQLQEIEGDEYRGVVKVKVGPITAQYKGTAKLESVDDATHTAVIVGDRARHPGAGQRVGDDQAACSLPDGDGTRGRGRHRPLDHRQGRAVRPRRDRPTSRPSCSRSSSRTSSATCCAATVVDLTDGRGGRGRRAGEPGEAVEDDGRRARRRGGGGARRAGGRAVGQRRGGPRGSTSPEAEPVDLLEVGGSPLARRLAPLAGAVVVVLLRPLAPPPPERR